MTSEITYQPLWLPYTGSKSNLDVILRIRFCVNRLMIIKFQSFSCSHMLPDLITSVTLADPSVLETTSVSISMCL